MLRALLRLRDAPPLARLSRLAHRIFDYLGFAGASFAVAQLLFLVLTLLICRLEMLETARQWGSFLEHYAAASRAQRAPVDLALATLLTGLSALVMAVRWPAARRGWSVAPERRRTEAEPFDPRPQGCRP